MIYTAKLTKISGSMFVIVPASIRNIIDAKEGDLLQINIEKINGEKVVKKYRCSLCDYIFDSDDKTSYCPICENEELQQINEETG